MQRRVSFRTQWGHVVPTQWLPFLPEAPSENPTTATTNMLPRMMDTVSEPDARGQFANVGSPSSNQCTQDPMSLLRRRSEKYHSLDIDPKTELEEASKINNELCSLLCIIHDNYFVNEEAEVGRTSLETHGNRNKPGPLSQFFIRHLPLLLATNTRQLGLGNLHATLSIFSKAVSGYETDKMTTKEKSQVLRSHERCVNFAKSLCWALNDLKSKIVKNRSELKIANCIKTVFNIVISLHWREQDGCEDRGQDMWRPEQTGFTALVSFLSYHNFNASETHLKAPTQNPNYVLDTSMFGSHQLFLNSSLKNGSGPYEKAAVLGQQSVFQGRGQPLSWDHALVTMFHSHMVPMTPVVARDSGMYVRGTQNSELSIMDAAYVRENQNGECIIPCTFVLNKTYTPENRLSVQGPRYLTYVGFVYPDGSMLSYVPIKSVRLVYENSKKNKPILRNGSTTFAFLSMDLPNSIYRRLKRYAKDAYLQKKPDVLFVDHFEELHLDGRTVRIEVLVKSERTVRIEDQDRYLDYPVLRALFHCRHDLCGKSLLHLRFTSTKRGSKRMQLRLILFGITVKRSQFNYNDCLFDLLNAPSGPIQLPLAAHD